jgi:hypothetical protein
LTLETVRDMKLFEEVQHYVKNSKLIQTTVEIKDSEESTDDSSVSMYIREVEKVTVIRTLCNSKLLSCQGIN